MMLFHRRDEHARRDGALKCRDLLLKNQRKNLGINETAVDADWYVYLYSQYITINARY